MDFAGTVRGAVPIDKFNQNIFHKIDVWNQGVDEVNDYFLIKEPTPVVIAPGSDMPYCLVHWVDGVPGAGDGWPAQAANPGAYVSLLKGYAQVTDETTWAPILLSHMPTWLEPGYYVPALPQIEYCGDQFGFYFAWPTAVLEWPEVVLMVSDAPVEISPYQYTIKEIVAGSTRNWYSPWLMAPRAAGGVASVTDRAWSKMYGLGASNQTGTNQVSVFRFYIRTKNRTRPDTAIASLYQDLGTITQINTGARSNFQVEGYEWFMINILVDDAGATAAGVGYIVF
jgi:hypothetical protein